MLMINWFIQSLSMVVKAGHKWARDRAPRMAAAMSFYAALSLAPLLIFAVSIAGLFFSTEIAQAELLALVEQFLGADGVELIEPMLNQTVDSTSSTIATVIGLLALVFGATSLFRQLQDSLNSLWRVPEKKQFGIISQLVKWGVSLLMVLLVGLLFVLMVMASAITEKTTDWIRDFAPGVADLILSADWGLIIILSFIIFMATFKMVPRTHIVWRDVLMASLVTAVLFFIGQALIGFYLGTFGGSSLYGLAGSLVAVLIWVYYSAQIILFGACLSYVYALERGSRKGQATVFVPGLDDAIAQLDERFPQAGIVANGNDMLVAPTDVTKGTVSAESSSDPEPDA
jgi:membrane protein